MENIDEILKNAEIDTGYTKTGALNIPLETIQKIDEAIVKNDETGLALTPEQFSEIVQCNSDISLQGMASKFNSVMKRDYSKIPIRASIRTLKEKIALVRA